MLNSIPPKYATDKAAVAFLLLAVAYLLLGISFGIIGGFQYIFPKFLNDQIPFQKSRPLHVYLVITWIFTAAQGAIYYFIPRISNRTMFWAKGTWVHFYIQLFLSIGIMIAFFMGYFGGREYLEFPPWMGAVLFISWIPFALNFFFTLKPDYRKVPVYIWSWSTGILFFFITLSESYLWVFDFFGGNIVRDVTVQWKALGSMVGSWNMLVYGTGFYLMEKLSNDTKLAQSRIAFFFYFLGLTNLMFNWGHHTYIVPAAPWIKTVAFVISMTELLILGHIIWNWRKTLSHALKTYHHIPFRLLSLVDYWIFLNLILAIAISVPALNYYTHGTHITVAHAMGATIGINTFLLFASVYHILQQKKPGVFQDLKIFTTIGIRTTSLSLLVFCIALIGSGMVKISGGLKNETFYMMMQAGLPYFKVFAYSGVLIFLGLTTMAIVSFAIIGRKEKIKTVSKNEEEDIAAVSSSVTL